MSAAPLPPDALSDEAANAWHRIYAFHVRRGTWQRAYVIGLEWAASHSALYLEIAREMRDVPADAPVYAEAAQTVEETRQVARQLLEQWHYIKPERVHLAAMNAEGLDADLVALCAPLAPEELAPR